MRHLAALLLLLSLAAPARADDGVAAAKARAASQWPGAAIESVVTSAPCPLPTEADAPTAVRNGVAQVRVRCPATPGWTRYLALTVRHTQPVALLRAPLARGQVLSEEHIEWQPRDVFSLPADALQSWSPAPRAARRDLPAGTVLLASQFNAAPAITRGQTVTLISRGAGLEIRAPGEALADAGSGMRVKVRNRTSRRVVEGIARDDGTVEVAS